MTRQGTKSIHIIINIIAVTITCIFLFRVQIASGFDILSGDRWDGVIARSFIEHWYNVFKGKAHWATMGYFYPHTGTLGYCEGFFLFGLISSFFRVIGLDMLTAPEAAYITIKIIGYFGFYYLCRSFFKIDFWSSMVGASMFTLGNLAWVSHTAHTQLLVVSFAPWLYLFILKYLQGVINRESKNLIIAYGCLAGLLLGAMLMSCFYMAFFSLLFILLCLLLFLLGWFVRGEKITELRPIWLKIRAQPVVILFPVVVSVIAMLPFLYVYLPISAQVGGHSWAGVVIYVPSVWNLIDPGPHNLLFGELGNYFFNRFFPKLFRAGEFAIGFSPLLLILLAISAVFWRRVKDDTFENIICRLFYCVTILSLVLMIKIGDTVLWKIIWEWVPGATAVRGVARYALFLTFPISLLAVIFLSRIKHRINGVPYIIIAILLVAGQVNLASPASFKVTEHRAILNAIAPPPTTCTSFYVAGLRPDDFSKVMAAAEQKKLNGLLNLHIHNGDALFFSEVFALRTINGFASANPPDAPRTLFPFDGYYYRLNEYVKSHKIKEGLCELNLLDLKWTAVDPKLPIRLVPLNGKNFFISSRDTPTLSEDGQFILLKASFNNQSEADIGKKSLYPLNIGVRIVSESGEIIRHLMPRTPLEHIPARSEREIGLLPVPVSEFTDADYIDVNVVQEGYVWLDNTGVLPARFSMEGIIPPQCAHCLCDNRTPGSPGE